MYCCFSTILIEKHHFKRHLTWTSYVFNKPTIPFLIWRIVSYSLVLIKCWIHACTHLYSILQLFLCVAQFVLQRRLFDLMKVDQFFQFNLETRCFLPVGIITLLANTYCTYFTEGHQVNSDHPLFQFWKYISHLFKKNESINWSNKHERMKT